MSKGAVGEAQERFRRVENLEFTVASIEHQPFCEGSFDFVICLRVLHHNAHREETVSELRRVLRIGGLLYAGESLWTKPF